MAGRRKFATVVVLWNMFVLAANLEERGLQDKERLLDRTKKIAVSREQNPLKFQICLIGSL